MIQNESHIAMVIIKFESATYLWQACTNQIHSGFPQACYLPVIFDRPIAGLPHACHFLQAYHRPATGLSQARQACHKPATSLWEVVQACSMPLSGLPQTYYPTRLAAKPPAGCPYKKNSLLQACGILACSRPVTGL